MVRLLIVVAGAGGLVARYFSGPEGLRRSELAKQSLAALQRQALRGINQNSPAARLLAQLGKTAIVARVARRGGIQGAIAGLIVDRLLRSRGGTFRHGGKRRRIAG